MRLRFRDLSYRHKIPLSVSFVIVVTALFVSAALALQSWRDVRRDVVANAESLGRTLSRALSPVILRDDLWSAYEIVTTPLDEGMFAPSADRVIVALTAQQEVYVASHPTMFPAQRPLSGLGPQYEGLAQRLSEDSFESTLVLEHAIPGRMAVVVPILADDGTALGRVLVLYSESIVLARVRATLVQVLLSTLAVLAVLLPIGWYAGNRIAVPLVRLATVLRRAGSEPSPRIARGLYTGGDEIGQVGEQLQRMLRELENKRTLENQVVLSDRLAAIGRLTAGIAHEINNPLGGMLNAISTQRRHGMQDPFTLKTLSLLERGLMQIRETVAALLVEARLESHALTRDDLEDIRTLVLPEATKKRVELHWENAVRAQLPLPSTPVRQVLINLLLNAVEAAHEQGFVSCRIGKQAGTLHLDVRNTGRRLSAGQMERLFEPFNSASGHGLGLWVTYQIVQQLRGEIRADNRPVETCFEVRLPLDEAA